jgi:hypothetical protein
MQKRAKQLLTQIKELQFKLYDYAEQLKMSGLYEEAEKFGNAAFEMDESINHLQGIG